MPSDPRADRKAKLRALREAQRAAREAMMLLSYDDLWALFDHVDAALEFRGCDHTLRHTRAFLASRGLDEAGVIPWLGEYGGYCDCEVIANVRSEWDDA